MHLLPIDVSALSLSLYFSSDQLRGSSSTVQTASMDGMNPDPMAISNTQRQNLQVANESSFSIPGMTHLVMETQGHSAGMACMDCGSKHPISLRAISHEMQVCLLSHHPFPFLPLFKQQSSRDHTPAGSISGLLENQAKSRRK